MKTGFKEHLLASLLFAVPAVFFIKPIELALAACLFFVASSLLPDVDHPKSIPRKLMRGLVFLLIFFSSTLALSFLFPKKDPFAAFLFLPATALLASLVITFIIEISIPKHRGKIHSAGAGLFLGLLVFVLFAVLVPFTAALSLGSSAFLGYLFHLLVDFAGDRI
jgi:hypothetical protein